MFESIVCKYELKKYKSIWVNKFQCTENIQSLKPKAQKNKMADTWKKNKMATLKKAKKQKCKNKNLPGSQWINTVSTQCTSENQNELLLKFVKIWFPWHLDSMTVKSDLKWTEMCACIYIKNMSLSILCH